MRKQMRSIYTGTSTNNCRYERIFVTLEHRESHGSHTGWEIRPKVDVKREFTTKEHVFERFRIVMGERQCRLLIRHQRNTDENGKLYSSRLPPPQPFAPTTGAQLSRLNHTLSLQPTPKNTLATLFRRLIDSHTSHERSIDLNC